MKLKLLSVSEIITKKSGFCGINCNLARFWVGFLVAAERVQLQFVLAHQFPNFSNIKGRKPRTTGN
jgi:hypothetical protein